jgi:hypothetical protein
MAAKRWPAHALVPNGGSEKTFRIAKATPLGP